MSSIVGKETNELFHHIKYTHPDIYNNIEHILVYLKIHNSNKNIYEDVTENGLIKTIKIGIINLLEEINTLTDINNNLQTDNNNLIENKNNIENEYIKIINKKRKPENDSNICEICFELDKNILLNCGHKFCGVCLIKNTNNKCPMCRTEITSKTDII